MKNLTLVLIISALSITVLSFSDSKKTTELESSNDKVSFEMPTDVKTVIDNTCYGCHNSGSKSTKGKMKLKFDKMPDMKTGKLVGKLSKISKVIKKDKMPPKKFLEHYPEKALSKEDSELIVSWADGLVKELSGE
ncbi:MAG: heme-binding domain-containing protein [Bacteroidota bacterium]